MRWRDLKKQTRIWGLKRNTTDETFTNNSFLLGKWRKRKVFEPVCIMNNRVIEKIYLEQCLCNTGSSTAGPSIRASLWWSLPSLLDPHLPPWACLAPPLLGSCQKSLWTSDSAYWFASIAQFLGCTTCSGREKSLDFGVFFQLVSSWLLSQCLLLLKWYVTAWVKKPSTASYVVDAVPSYLPHHKVDCWNVFSKPNCDQGFQWKEQSARFSTEDAAFVRVFNEQSGARGFQATERE